MKRLISIEVILLFIAIFHFTVFAQGTEREVHTFEDWDYVTNTTGLTLTQYRGNDSNIDIPAQIYNITVTALGEDLFKNNSNIRAIYIPDTVTSIGRYAFHGCTSLTDIRLPQRLLRIEPYTFRYCTALEYITLPETLTYIGAYSFSGCVAMKEIVIPDSVTTIGESAFDDCTSLESISVSRNLTHLDGNGFRNTPWLAAQTDEFVLLGNTILLKWNGSGSFVDVPYGVTEITDAFVGNSSVESITLPATVTRIGQNAFRDAVNLKNVMIPDTVTRIDGYAFQGCRSLRAVTLPDSITAMGTSVFRSCEKLAQIDLPNRISSISSYLLADCESLTEVVIPSSVTSIHDTAFNNSNQVRLHVTYDSEGERFAQSHLIAYTYYLQQTKDFIYTRNEDGIQILRYIGNLFDVEIPDMIDGLPVNRINTAAFQNNAIARSVIIPDGVKTIGDWAFSYMDSLESVKMPLGLTSLGADAFTGSKKLQSVSIPKGVETIGVEPFDGIDGLTICAVSGSYAADALNEMGYMVSAADACSVEPGTIRRPEMADLISATETPEISATPDSSDSAVGTPESEPTAETPVLVAESTVTATPAPTMTATVAVTNTAAPTNTATMMPTATYTPTMTNTPTMMPTPTPTGILYIAADTTDLSADMLENTTRELTVIIPASVTTIDESILDGHVLTIVSDPGSAAEAFARKWDLKFLISTWYEADHADREND